MRLSWNFLVPFCGIIVLGGAFLILVARPGEFRDSKQTKSESTITDESSTADPDSLPVESAISESDRLETVSESQSTSEWQPVNLANETAPMQIASHAPERPITAARSSESANYLSNNALQAQPPVESTNPVRQLTQGGLTDGSNSEPDSSGPSGSPRVQRRQAFTIEEQWYRYWHGWSSIDAYRQSQSHGGH